MFYQLSKFDLVSKPNQTSHQNFAHRYLDKVSRRHGQVDRVLPLESDRKRT